MQATESAFRRFYNRQMPRLFYGIGIGFGLILPGIVVQSYGGIDGPLGGPYLAAMGFVIVWFIGFLAEALIFVAAKMGEER